jgi:oxalate decarboxylase family bicupin protein/NRAMP (natural resistance-associated macrophage protein)-like metal ion transporter
MARILGPAFVAAIAYVDPGNVATNLAAGATTGYLLVWVVVVASLVAILVQFQAAKLGMATGRSLPQLCRDRLPRWGTALVWLQAEVVVLATDLAEFVGAAIGMRLLFGMPVIASTAVTAVVSMLLLELRRRGRTRGFELMSAATLVLVGTGVGYDVLLTGHQSGAGLAAGLLPSLAGEGSLVLAMGIVGATVMPHAIYLHSALVQHGDMPVDAAWRQPSLVRRALSLDCALALGAATVVNVSLVALGAGLGAATGGAWTGDLVAAHTELASRIGGGAALAFAIALLSSGISSTGVGTLAGDVVMRGLLDRRARRAVPARPFLPRPLGYGPARQRPAHHTRLRCVGGRGRRPRLLPAVHALTAPSAFTEEKGTVMPTPQDLPQPQRDGQGGIDTGPRNIELDRQNPDLLTPPPMDHGTLPNMKFSFSMAHTRIEQGGWTREVTQRELPIATTLAGVDMKLNPGTYRELHWHKEAEWAYVLEGSCRIGAVDQAGCNFLDDVEAGDLWFFPKGVPHYIQALDEGVEFLLVFDDGGFSENSTFMLSDFFAHTPKSVLAKNFGWTLEQMENLPEKEKYIFQGQVPPPLSDSDRILSPSGDVPRTFKHRMLGQTPMRFDGGTVRITDSTNFAAATTISAALVELEPGALRELHWHPTDDEWQY